MEYAQLFTQLAQSETEDEVEQLLLDGGYLCEDESMWKPLGNLENNFAAVGNQQSDATGALIEKIINGIDAVLMARCFEEGIDPTAPNAPQSMAEAVERFYGVRDGRISTLGSAQRQQLADTIHLVAVGSKANPNYLVIDRGEGQTPARFPDTFVSIMQSNKMRIPFVQGKFNSGGLGILQFCGDRNFQLIASRRHPSAPIFPGDDTANLWGFTIVRRLRPSEGRRSSMYVYLAPDGRVPSFSADAIRVLPGPSGKKRPGTPYTNELEYGTCIKLYNFRWKGKTLATTTARYEIEGLLHVPALPFRIDETREGYSANYYSTTVSGGWDTATTSDDGGESTKLEEGFPAFAELSLPNIGNLPYQIAVYREEVKKRHVPYGVYFVINGQVHGSLPADFVSRKLKFDRLAASLFVSVDCTNMAPIVREDFFMASRDRVRRNEVYAEIERHLTDDLRTHPGLQEINQLRRQKEMERPLDEDASVTAFQQILNADPSLAGLFSTGDRLVTTTGPAPPTRFEGKQFPTFFRLAKEPQQGLVKSCPLNKTVRIEFETDAANDYFNRLDSPGMVTINPPDILHYNRLWNGRWETRFLLPWDAQPGDSITVNICVTDVEREMRGGPFEMAFILNAMPEVSEEPNASGHPNPPGDYSPNNRRTGPVLAVPKIREVHRDEWEQHHPSFHKFEAIRIKHGDEGGYDYLVNADSAYLLTELNRTNDELKRQVRFWFNYGLVLAAIGMIKYSAERQLQPVGSNGHVIEEDSEAVDLDEVSQYCNGLARVIVPIIGSLSRAQVT